MEPELRNANHISLLLDKFRREGETSLDAVLTAAELDGVLVSEIRNSWVLPEIQEARFSHDVVSVKLED